MPNTMNTPPPSFYRLAAYTTVALFFAPYFFQVLTGQNGHLVLLTDDFYYYSIAARNILQGHGSTFDGVTITNGYHPMFMGLLIAIQCLSQGAEKVYFLLIFGVSALASVASFELMLKLARRLTSHPNLAGGAAVLLTLEACRLCSWGMETTLTVPLSLLWLLLIARHHTGASFKAALQMGLASALLVLSRLDAVLLVALLLAGCAVVCIKVPRGKARALAGFALGGLPLPAYFLFNLLTYGHVLTVSAQSKQISSGLVFNSSVLPGLFSQPLGILGAALIPIGLLLVALEFKKTRTWHTRLTVQTLALVFPILFFTVYGLRSDWILFQWYFYPLIPAVFVALLRLGEPAFTHTKRQYQTVMAAVACLIPIASAASIIPRRTTGLHPETIALYAHARQLNEFANTHPGFYAMGDRAGLTAYIMGQPVLQLEGLMADQAMVEHIRRQDDLDQVLRDYKVDYMITSVYQYLPSSGGCAHVEAPHAGQAGIHSHKMSGTFCQQTVLLIESPRGNLPGTVYTYVFKVSAR